MNAPASLLVGLSVVAFAAEVTAAERRTASFDDQRPLDGIAVEGPVSIDATRGRGEAGGALRVGPGGKVVWELRDANGSGVVEMWVYDDGSAPADPKQHGAGPMWGLIQRNGPVLTVGALYAPYLSGDRTYATSEFDPAKGERPWWAVQYLGVKREARWRKWTFDFDADAGLTVFCDDADVNARRQMFNWDRTNLRGFTGVALFGDSTDASQVLWVDDIAVTLGGPVRTRPIWPPPPPLTLAPRPWGEEHTATPYDRWTHGPARGRGYFPIAVWLQDPKNALRYKEAGFDLYVGLWKGPTEAQLAALRDAGMSVICAQNAVGLKHADDKTIVGWMHGDEPDNAQRRPDGEGYGPPIAPAKIVEDYEAMVRADPSRPVLLNLGQGVAWDKWHGRGVRTNHPEDYPEYVKGCDIASFDIYPVVHRHSDVAGRLWYVPLGVSRLREWAGDRKPVWNCIECTRIGNPNVKPTPHQVRAEVWMSIIFGSRGLIYFVHQFEPNFVEAALLEDPEMLQAVTALNRQIRDLASVINSPSVPDLVTVESSAEIVPIRLTVRRQDGARYVFAVSMFHEEAKGTFRVGGVGPNAVAEVLGEDRTIQVVNGSFEDDFAGYGVHLYRIQ